MKSWWVTALLVVLPTVASAQVNTEKLRSWDQDGFGGALDFSLFLRSGNVDLVQVGAGARVQYVTLHPLEAGTSTVGNPRRHAKDLVLFIGNLALGRRDDSKFLNNGFSHLRYTRMWWRRLGSEAFAQAQYNEFLRLRQRLLLGLGARFMPIDEDWGEVAIGSAPMLEIEEVSDDAGVDIPHTTNVRWSNYVSLKLYMDEPAVQFVNTLYFQPRFDQFSDFRALSEGELSVAVTTVFSLVATLTVFYDSRPPPTVKRTDVTLTNALRLTF